MKKPNSIRFILSASKILSVNALYGAKLSFYGSRPIATMYKKGDARKMEEYIREQVKILDIPNKHPWINEKTLFKLNFTVIFKSGYLRRDLDNCCKNLIDGIWRAMNLNDSHIVEIQCEKTLCKEFPEEKILVELSEYVGEPRFDVLKEDKPIPTRVFLGGTNSEDNWKEKIIAALEKRGFEYYNPEESEEDIETKNLIKDENCDSHLYVLTPELKGVYSIAEIINSSWEVREHNFGSCIVGIMGSKEEWGEEMWESLESMIKMIKKIGCESPKIVIKNITDPRELLDCYGKPKKKRKV